MTGHVLVTGASGNVGAELLRLLAKAGVPTVAASRSALSSPPPGISEVRFDFEAPETFRRALEGTNRVFLVRPPAMSDVRRHMVPFLDSAADAGVRHVVFLSLLGAERNRWVPHRAIEQYLRAGPMEWTFLRAAFFMQNLSTTHREEIRERNEIDLPAGSARTSFVDVRDIALAALVVLTTKGHERRAYDLTGAEALTYVEVADIFTEVLGRPITYRRSSLLGFLLRSRARGRAWPMLLVMAAIYTTARLGLAGHLSDDLPRLTGEPPLSLRRFVEDYKALW